MMEKLHRQVYTSEFRQQAVGLITRDGLSIAEAARRLAISPKTLLNWVRRAKSGGLPDDADGVRRHVVTEQEAELSRLRRENAELRMERDILKNVWLRRRSQPQNESSWHKAGRMQQMYLASLE
jgi:transposase